MSDGTVLGRPSPHPLALIKTNPIKQDVRVRLFSLVAMGGSRVSRTLATETASFAITNLQAQESESFFAPRKALLVSGMLP